MAENSSNVDELKLAALVLAAGNAQVLAKLKNTLDEQALKIVNQHCEYIENNFCVKGLRRYFMSSRFASMLQKMLKSTSTVQSNDEDSPQKRLAEALGVASPQLNCSPKVTSVLLDSIDNTAGNGHVS